MSRKDNVAFVPPVQQSASLLKIKPADAVALTSLDAPIAVTMGSFRLPYTELREVLVPFQKIELKSAQIVKS